MFKVNEDDITFLGKCSFRNVLVFPSSTLNNSATPDVTNLLLVKASGDIVTITNFLGGRDSVELRIIGDGTTTIANNTTIKTNTGVAKLLSLNSVYSFSYFGADNCWYEHK